MGQAEPVKGYERCSPCLGVYQKLFLDEKSSVAARMKWDGRHGIGWDETGWDGMPKNIPSLTEPFQMERVTSKFEELDSHEE